MVVGIINGRSFDGTQLGFHEQTVKDSIHVHVHVSLPHRVVLHHILLHGHHHTPVPHGLLSYFLQNKWPSLQHAKPGVAKDHTYSDYAYFAKRAKVFANDM